MLRFCTGPMGPSSLGPGHRLCSQWRSALLQSIWCYCIFQLPQPDYASALLVASEQAHLCRQHHVAPALSSQCLLPSYAGVFMTDYTLYASCLLLQTCQDALPNCHLTMCGEKVRCPVFWLVPLYCGGIAVPIGRVVLCVVSAAAVLTYSGSVWQCCAPPLCRSCLF